MYKKIEMAVALVLLATGLTVIGMASILATNQAFADNHNNNNNNNHHPHHNNNGDNGADHPSEL